MNAIIRLSRVAGGAPEAGALRFAAGGRGAASASASASASIARARRASETGVEYSSVSSWSAVHQSASRTQSATHSQRDGRRVQQRVRLQRSPPVRQSTSPPVHQSTSPPVRQSASPLVTRNQGP
eukprot:3828420-Pyramimonas_sp.AAC.1